VSATSVAQAVWSYSPRSLTDIQSLVSAIQNNDPSLLSTPSDAIYVPVPYYSGQVSLTQVAAFIDNAVRNYGWAGITDLYIVNNPYNLWNTNFVASLALNPYLTATSLSMLILNDIMNANVAQLILYQLAQNYYYNKWIYTVTASAPSSITFSTNVTLSTNVLIAQNITIASGVTVTCGTRTCFFVAQSFNNYGTVVSPYGAGGGGGSNGGGGRGGAGGGGVVIIAYTAAIGTINVNGGAGGGGAYSSVPSPGSPSAGAGGYFAVVSGVTVPSGGAGGTGPNYGGGAGEPNAGGGGGSNTVGGTGGIATVASFSSPNAMVTYILQGLSDWWLIKVLGMVPSSTTPLVFMYGSGGGGGGGGTNYGAGGGGGGAGEVIAYGYNIISGTIDAAGGVGGTGDVLAGGGGGGAGGLVFIFYGATSGNVTANVKGGAGGVSGTSPYYGNTGANGTAYIAQVTVNG
jgi:hypothetical protein